MPRFFIDRPIFAWVVAIFIVLFGLIALPMLPIAQYPNVAPPQVTISTVYPGASAEDLYLTVTKPIEEELNGIPGLIYYESTSDATGSVSITVTFESGTEIAQAMVDTQNRIGRVEASLPSVVQQQGVQVEEAGNAFLMVVSLISDDGTQDAVALGDFVQRNIVNEIRRVPGVGRAQVFASERAMRIWLDPDKMVGYDLSTAEVVAAIRAQNAQVAAGSIGAAPNPVSQQTTATVLVTGQLTTPEEFGAIVLRSNQDGSLVRLRDVATTEVDAQSYAFSSYLDGKPAAAVGVQLSPTGNALATSEAVHDLMKQLEGTFPPGVSYSIPYDTSPFVEESITKVIHTLIEAMVLVFIVMFVFLQNFRYTIIPTIVVPIALCGTLAVMLVAGFSINVLTMFAMVLAIGILVDDAILVVENVERIMSEEGLSPKDATKKAMSQITGAIVGITLVLCAVFVPLAFFPGSVGIIYQQFSLTMVVSILFSALMALSLTPALCGTILKPVKAGHHHTKGGPAGWFNRNFDRAAHGYSRGVGRMVRRTWRFMIIYLALLAGMGYLFINLPSAFLPQEDQGFLIASFQGPSDATDNRMRSVTSAAEKIVMQNDAVDTMITIQGFSFSGAGQNASLAFITLKDWGQRGAGQDAASLGMQFSIAFSQFRDAIAFALSPPPIQGLGTTGGFEFRLQQRSGGSSTELAAARDQLMAAASQSPVLAGMRVEGLPDGPQVLLHIDREKANTFGVTFANINETISTALGSNYVNDFPNNGRMQQVTVQAQDRSRTNVQDILNLNVVNQNGASVPISAFADVTWTTGTAQAVGYNGYPAVRISGQAAPGYASGDAIAEMERLAGELPQGFSFEWTGQSLQEIQSGSQAPALIGLSIFVVFLVLAALYESWAIPLSVMLVVPLGVIGAVAAVTLRGLSNDVYFTVGIITIIGLSAKNAILIVEFAKELREDGKSLHEATIEACRLRFRPILMTSLAFSMGVIPMAIATGASAASQNALGTAVLGGMISATVLAVFLVPVFFVFVLNNTRADRVLEAHARGKAGAPGSGTQGQGAVE
ncbi:multidrug efflux RND transporter permease subunit (plasmid) [Paroceanicella profunda]|uniref:Efflux pump membrane transporter n=1 Tax=Paroceanicella profunda TaxID=2579971 RepID=A0A5B8FJL9_9RHOB|nr:efflux RND transporter permease subunit [Paroceanicella profunda]QDL94468.1 multidrug efflux RND transporter permease subunit [Paroceanicella profunda]